MTTTAITLNICISVHLQQQHQHHQQQQQTRKQQKRQKQQQQATTGASRPTDGRPARASEGSSTWLDDNLSIDVAGNAFSNIGCTPILSATMAAMGLGEEELLSRAAPAADADVVDLVCDGSTDLSSCSSDSE